MESDIGMQAPGEPLALALDLLEKGGPAIWAIVALSVLGLALILWKLVSLSAQGAWSRRGAERAVARYLDGDEAAALSAARSARGACARVVATAIETAHGDAPRGDAISETTRVAKRELGTAQSGLRGLELIATIAPLLGLLGTVLGMISAFQALETAGAAANASALAGGIWEALLTTAAGMGVAIPASAALTWYESVIDRLRRDMEDMAGRIFNARTRLGLAGTASPHSIGGAARAAAE